MKQTQGSRFSRFRRGKQEVSFVVFLCATVTQCLISFGANLGNPVETLQQVQQALVASPLHVVAVSPLMLTRPAGGPTGQPPYSNAALLLETTVNLQGCFAELQRIEQQIGRQRAPRWNARIVDLDLLLFGSECHKSDTITVPHPRFCFRRFALEPATRVAADLPHPALGLTVKQLLVHLDSTKPYIALSGSDPLRTKRVVQDCCANTMHTAIQESELELATPSALGQPEETAIELLRASAAAVKLTVDSIVADGYAISDYWCERVAARTWQDPRGSAGAAILAAWKEIADTTPRPRLLVRWEPESTPLLAEAAKELDDYIAANRVGPVLWLRTDDESWVRQELLAAITAMSQSVMIDT